MLSVLLIWIHVLPFICVCLYLCMVYSISVYLPFNILHKLSTHKMQVACVASYIYPGPLPLERTSSKVYSVVQSIRIDTLALFSGHYIGDQNFMPYLAPCY